MSQLEIGTFGNSEKSQSANTPYKMDNLHQHIEALVFSSETAVTVADLIGAMNKAFPALRLIRKWWIPSSTIYRKNSRAIFMRLNCA